jgi:putative holliday junction resolvase
MKILGLDYGSRRIGVAISDELGMIARGLTTLMRKNREADLDAIVKLVSLEGIEKIVIGYPLRLDGSEGIQCEKINRFIGRLEMRLSLPVVRWDETLSTKEAEQLLYKRGLCRSKEKTIVDRIAASIILQGYLDAMARQKDTETPFRKDETV